MGSKLALALPKMNPFILSPRASFKQITVNRVDFGLWTVDAQTLVLGTNMNNAPQVISLSQIGLPVTGSSSGITQVLDTGVTLDPARGHLDFAAVGTGAWVFKL